MGVLSGYGLTTIHKQEILRLIVKTGNCKDRDELWREANALIRSYGRGVQARRAHDVLANIFKRSWCYDDDGMTHIADFHGIKSDQHVRESINTIKKHLTRKDGRTI